MKEGISVPWLDAGTAARGGAPPASWLKLAAPSQPKGAILCVEMDPRGATIPARWNQLLPSDLRLALGSAAETCCCWRLQTPHGFLGGIAILCPRHWPLVQTQGHMAHGHEAGLTCVSQCSVPEVKSSRCLKSRNSQHMVFTK